MNQADCLDKIRNMIWRACKQPKEPTAEELELKEERLVSCIYYWHKLYINVKNNISAINCEIFLEFIICLLINSLKFSFQNSQSESWNTTGETDKIAHQTK